VNLCLRRFLLDHIISDSLAPLIPATPQQVIQFSGPSSFLPARSGTEDHEQTDLLVDGFISRTFGSRDTEKYLNLLLQEPRSSNFLQRCRILCGKGAWYITRNSNLVQGLSPGFLPQAVSLLDYIVTDNGTVVPQIRWTPHTVTDIRQHVEEAVLQLPIFFVNRNGGLGFRLPDTLRGCDRELRNAYDPASLGSKSTTHIRINVSRCPSY
jgi:hypothetical protein